MTLHFDKRSFLKYLVLGEYLVFIQLGPMDLNIEALIGRFFAPFLALKKHASIKIEPPSILSFPAINVLPVPYFMNKNRLCKAIHLFNQAASFWNFSKFL